MKVSTDEEIFLRHWMYDEMHFGDGVCQAKRLQVEHQVRPADLGTLIAAAIPDGAEQWAAGEGPPPSESPVWPWSGETFEDRLREAEAVLATRGQAGR
jgi:hypothetical protein